VQQSVVLVANLSYREAAVILGGMTTPKNASSAPGAAAALAGYDYQLDVSVLAALRLMLVNKSAEKITLEPANEEDLEADLAPDVPGRVVPSGQVAGGYKLVVQVKLSNGEPWSLEDFDQLLNHGVTRKPAREHLDDLNTRYLLVTNAGVKGVALKLIVSDFEEASDPKKFPPKLKKTLRKKPEGRVAIWGNLGERQLDLEIDHILRVVLRIPHPRHKDCRQALREEAKRRMRGSVPGEWTKEDLLSTVRSLGGYLANMEELEYFVEPANFQSMVSQLDMRNAIVITGSSGTGKTWAALALCDYARRRDGALDVVTVTPGDGPAAVRRLVHTGPTLFYIEDPWGQYTLQPQGETWTEHLPRLLRLASPSHQYVITSRRDMLRQTEVGDVFKPWTIELNAEHYGGGELEKIYEKRMAALPAQRQGAALVFRERALERLETPLELDLFFGGLLDGPAPQEESYSFMQRILGNAHRNAVADVVAKYLTAIGNTCVSAAIWALLARGGFTRQQLGKLQRAMRRADPAFADLLDKTTDRLIATRHLRQPSQTVSFAHPSVREGFEKYLHDNWWSSAAALETLIAALACLDEPDQAWGVETAAHILHAAVELSTEVRRSFDPPTSIREGIDAWLAQALVDPRAKFPALIHLAAKAGSAQLIPAELARWFLAQTQPIPFADKQDEPAYSDTWYARVRSDPASAVIADRFVREQLLQESHFVGKDFLVALARIADGLTPAFLAAAEAAVGRDFDQHLEVVAEGAVRDIDGYERVLAKALDALALAWANSPDDMAELEALLDDELDAPEVTAFHDRHEMAGATETELIEIYVDAKRRSGDWRDIVHHLRADDLRRFWVEEAFFSRRAWVGAPARLRMPASEDEIGALLEAAHGTRSEALAWNTACLCWATRFEALLAQRLAVPVENGDLREALVHCACAHAPAILKDVLQAVAAIPVALVSLLADLHALSEKAKDGAVPAGMLDDWPEAEEILYAFASADNGGGPVSGAALALLEACTETAPIRVLAKVVPVLIASGNRPVGAIRRWIAQACEGNDAAAAVRAAIEIDDDGLANLSLEHVRADARCEALVWLAGKSLDPLPPRLLGMAEDRSSRVRLALVRSLTGRLHPDHARVLTGLAHDEWADAKATFEEPGRFTVARTALAALSAYPSLPSSIGPRLLALATTTADRMVCRSALRVAASRCGAAARQALWALANDENFRPGRAVAMVALRDAPLVEPGIVDAIDAARLLAWPPALSVTATELLAAHAAPMEAARSIETAGQVSSHRVLLLVGAWSLAQRDRKAAEGLLALLPPEHPARTLLDGPAALPEAALDDLGDVRIRQYVKQWLKARANPEPPNALIELDG
jgi:hypothetical protein